MAYLDLGLVSYYSPLEFLAGESFHVHANRLNLPLLNSLDILSSLNVRMRESFYNITYVDIGHVLQVTGILIENNLLAT